MSTEVKESKLRTITPEDLAGGFTERVEIDPNANAFTRPAPLLDGTYIGQITVPVKGGKYDREPLQGGRDKNGHDYFFGNFDIKIVGSMTPEITEASMKGRSKQLRGKVNTFEKTDAQGRSSNEMATLAILAGAQPNGDTLSDIGLAYLAVLKAGAKVGVVIQWQAGHSVAVAGKSYKNWEVVRRGMTNFPKNVNSEGEFDGTYNPTITYNGEELTARAEIVGFVRL